VTQPKFKKKMAKMKRGKKTKKSDNLGKGSGENIMYKIQKKKVR